MFTLTIVETGNAAFEDDLTDGYGREVARILRETADRVESTGRQSYRLKLYDSNGNAVGTAESKVDD